MNKKLASGMALTALLVAPSAQAGVIFTNEAAFNAAVAGLSTKWTEDFEGFAIGNTPSVTTIGGGNAEIAGLLGGSNNQILTGGPSQVWGTNSAASPVIRGAGNASLDVIAFSFDFVTQNAGTWKFNLDGGGVDTSAAFGGGACCDPVNFIGWIAGAGEMLESVAFDNAGMAIDNIAAFVPAPGTLWLLLYALGLFGLVQRRREV